MQLNQLVSGVVLTKSCSIKPSGDSERQKTVTLKVKFDGVTLQDVFAKALSQVVVQWQNGPGRKLFDKWSHGQVIEVEFKAPGKTAVDPKMAAVAVLAAMTNEERLAFIQMSPEEQIEFLNSME